MLWGRMRSGLRVREGDPTIRYGPDVPTPSIVPFWVGPREAPELVSAFEILRHHPNPGEAVVPVLAFRGANGVGTGAVYAQGEGAFLFGVSTVPTARRRGVATAIIRWMLSHPPAGRAPFSAILSESLFLERPLRSMGFVPWGRWRLYDLAPNAELALPPVAASVGPLWRPPKK